MITLENLSSYIGQPYEALELVFEGSWGLETQRQCARALPAQAFSS